MSHWGVVVPTPPGAPPPTPDPRPTLPAWSYSRFAKWSKCPASAYYAYILRIPEPASEAMERGTRLHTDAAVCIDDPDNALGGDLSAAWTQRLRDFGTSLRGDVETELQAAFRKDWTRTEWFARDAWCRVVFDAFAYQSGTGVVQVHEHKSGRPRAEHTQQATLYAAAASIILPDLAVEVTINYLDLDPVKSGGVVRHHFPPELARKQVTVWNERVAPMMTDTDYPATPGLQCRWCSFAASKGGPCEKA